MGAWGSIHPSYLHILSIHARCSGVADGLIRTWLARRGSGGCLSIDRDDRRNRPESALKGKHTARPTAGARLEDGGRWKVE